LLLAETPWYQKYMKYRPTTIRNVALMVSDATLRRSGSKKAWRPIRRNTHARPNMMASLVSMLLEARIKNRGKYKI
jgi:hypothetical protein